jgi:Glycine/serine hydroxymethyltransferase
MTVYFTKLEAVDFIIGKYFSHGGHLTQRYQVNFKAKFLSSFAYGVRPDNGMKDWKS